MKPERMVIPIALSPDDAAAALGISRSSLDKLVREGKIRPPVPIPGLRGIFRFDREQLYMDWLSFREESQNGNANPWDE